MKNAIDVEALDEAVARALSTQVDGYDCSTSMIVGGVVERATKGSKSLEGWFFPVSAVVTPLLELTAAVIANPLGDNSEAAEDAVKKMTDNVREARRTYFKDFKEFVGGTKPASVVALRARDPEPVA